jgi:hydrogenase/urease accessory protein HupE
VTFFAGFTLATGALLLGGMALGRLATQPRLRWVVAVAGVGTGSVGALMLRGLA